MPPVSPATVKGAIHSVPCPHCGKGNDFREIEENLVDTGQKVICDECDQPMEVVQVVKVTTITVRQWPHG